MKVMENNIKTQLDELEQQRAQLLIKQKEIEKEASYYKLIDQRDEFFRKEKEIISYKNSITEQLFDILSKDDVVKGVIRLERGEKIITYPSYRNDELKEKDKFQPTSTTSLTIQTDFGRIHEISVHRKKLKAHVPYQISSRSQPLLPSTIIKKIKEKIKENKAKLSKGQQLEKAKNELIEEFKSKYPKAIIAPQTEYIRDPYGSRSFSVEAHTLTITFPNTSQVKIHYYGDKSFSIMKMKDHRTIGKGKMELIDYLASDI
jgi:hypothetical protein